MPLETRFRAQSGGGPGLDLPPVYEVVTLREVGDAFVHAQEIAAERGAGTFVYVGRFDLAEFAVVLEPDEPLRAARRAFYAGCVALADALIVRAPPEKPIHIEWPGAFHVDHGLVGGARLAWPTQTREDEVPSWLVFGAMIRTVSLGEGEPGLHPLTAALEDEGFDGTGSAELAEGFARHLMVAMDKWQESGFGEVAKDYLARLVPEKGARREIADNGDLVVRRMGKAAPERQSLVRALADPAWLDPQTGGPRR